MNDDDDHQHHFDSNASVTQLPCIQSDGKPGTYLRILIYRRRIESSVVLFELFESPLIH